MGICNRPPRNRGTCRANVPRRQHHQGLARLLARENEIIIRIAMATKGLAKELVT